LIIISSCYLNRKLREGYASTKKRKKTANKDKKGPAFVIKTFFGRDKKNKESFDHDKYFSTR